MLYNKKIKCTIDAIVQRKEKSAPALNHLKMHCISYFQRVPSSFRLFPSIRYYTLTIPTDEHLYIFSNFISS